MFGQGTMASPLMLAERKPPRKSDIRDNVDNSKRKIHGEDFAHRCLFPLISEALVQGEVHKILLFLVGLIRQIQLIAASFFVTSQRVWPAPQPAGIAVLRWFLTLGIHEAGSLIGYGIFQCAYFVLLMGWTLYMVVKFVRTRYCSDFEFFIAKCLYFVVNPVLTPIVGSWLCEAFARMVRSNGTWDSIVWFALFILFFAAVFTVDYFWSAVSTKSVVIRGQWAAVWRSEVRMLTTVQLVIGGMGALLDLFPVWAQGAASLSMICIFACLMFLLWYFPYVHFYINVYSAVIVAFGILAQILAIVVVSSRKPVHLYLQLVLPIVAALFVAGPIIILTMVAKSRKIVKHLSISPDGEDKDIPYDDFAPKTVRGTVSWIYLGLMKGCLRVLDRSFLEYAMARYESAEVKFAALQIMCFFPGESTFCRNILEELDQVDNYHYTWLERCFMFQMRRIILVRTGATKDFFIHLKSLKDLTRQCSQAVRTIWLDLVNPRVKASFPVFKEVVDVTAKYNNQFVEATKKYPNVPQMSDAYAQFLIECASDFETAIEWKWFEELLRSNDISNMDDSFQSFVNAFPKFIINEVITPEGRIKIQQKSPGLDLTRAVSYALMTEDEVTYMGKKDVLLDKSITNGKLRMAIQHSLKKAHLVNLQKLSGILGLQALILPIVFILIWIFVPIMDNKAIVVMQELEYLMHMNLYMRYVDYVAALQMVIRAGLYPGVSQIVKDLIYDEELARESLVAITYPWLATFDGVTNIAQALSEFIGLLGTHYDDIQTMMEIIFDATSVIPMYPDSDLSYEIYDVSQKQTLLYYLDQCYVIIDDMEKDLDDFETRALSVIYIGSSLSAVIERLSSELQKFWDNMLDEDKNVSMSVAGVLTAVCLVFFLVFNTYFLLKLDSEVTETIAILSRTRKETVKKSFLPISNEAQPISCNSGSVLVVRRQNYICLTLFFLVLISVFVPCGLVFCMPYSNYVRMERIRSYFHWHIWSAKRATSVLTAAESAIVLHRMGPQTPFDIAFNESIERLQQSQEDLLVGTQFYSSIVGHDLDLDKFHLVDFCAETAAGTDLAGVLGCNSIDRGISYAQFLFAQLRRWTIGEGEMSSHRSFSELIVYIDRGLLYAFADFQEMIVTTVNDMMDESDSSTMILCVVGIILSPILVFFVFIRLRYLKVVHEGIKQVIRFLPPEHILHSQSLLAIALGQSEANLSSELMSPSQAVIATIGLPAIAVDKSEIIETVNTAFTTMTGLMRDQVVGQTLYVILARMKNDASVPTDEIDGVQQIQRAMKTMREGSKDRTATFYFQSRLDSGKKLQIEVIMIGNGKNHEFDGCDSFVLFLKDITQLHEQKQQVKEVKRQAAELLEDIIPREANRLLVVRNTDVIFSSERATVTTVRFQSKSSMFSPKEAVEANRLFLDLCEQGVSQSPMLHTLHIWNDMYIVLSGLFDSAYGQEEQVREAMRFCTQIVSYQQSMTQQSGFPYVVSCGIAHGKLIGGIADPQALVFDVAGEIVGVSEALARRSGINVNETAKSVMGTTGFQFIENKTHPVSYQVIVVPQ